MREIEADFLDLYKSVDNVCRDMYRGKHYYNSKREEVFGLRAYIADMEKIGIREKNRFPSWDSQYRTLKHLNWIRTQIAHDVGGSECDENDLNDLERFYDQLMNQTDILAQVYKKKKAVVPEKEPEPEYIPRVTHAVYTPVTSRKKKRSIGAWLFGIALAAAVIALICVCVFIK